MSAYTYDLGTFVLCSLISDWYYQDRFNLDIIVILQIHELVGEHDFQFSFYFLCSELLWKKVFTHYSFDWRENYFSYRSSASIF